jgi:hypothetical protein
VQREVVAPFHESRISHAFFTSFTPLVVEDGSSSEELQAATTPTKRSATLVRVIRSMMTTSAKQSFVDLQNA